jgi:hypothetical protein
MKLWGCPARLRWGLARLGTWWAHATGKRREMAGTSWAPFALLGCQIRQSAQVTAPALIVKNSETTGVTTILAGFGVVWAMPLLFAVAGIRAWHSLGKRGPGRFAVARCRTRAASPRPRPGPGWCCSRRCRSA